MSRTPAHHTLLLGLATLRGDPPPQVRIGLTSGATLDGQLASVDDDGITLLTEHQRVAVVAADRVEWVETTLNAATRRLLELREPRMGDNPSEADLRRRAQQLAAARTVATGVPCVIVLPWEQMPDADDARGDLGDLLDLLHACLERIAGEPLGASALRPIRTIDVRMGSVGVSREGQRLTIGIHTDGARLDLPRDLMVAIEAVL